jgi:hypothetical protein
VTAKATPTAANAMASSSTSRDLMMPYLRGKMTQITTARLGLGNEKHAQVGALVGLMV